MIRTTITKEGSFAAAHRVSTQVRPNGEENKCRNIHGHMYNYTIYVEGYTKLPIYYDKFQPDNEGMLIDYYQLSQVEKLIKYIFDHGILYWDSDLEVKEMFKSTSFKKAQLPYPPTAEVISFLLTILTERYLQEITGPNFIYDRQIKVQKVVVREAPGTSACYEKPKDTYPKDELLNANFPEVVKWASEQIDKYKVKEK
jgi:6-pyruvoyl-tetrahydropterin synthase